MLILLCCIIYLEGYGMYCSFDYMTRSPSNRAFVAFLVVSMYVLPMAAIMYFYCQVLTVKRSTEIVIIPYFVCVVPC